MNRPFLITSLPRSGTAWCANLMTHAGVYCRHEGLAQDGVTALRDWLSGGNLPRGNSDSTIPFHLSNLTMGAEHNLVIIRRDFDEALESLGKFLRRGGVDFDAGVLEESVSRLDTKIRQLRKTSTHLEIEFEELTEPSTARRIWDYCAPGIPFDSERAELLRVLNVQQNLSAVLA